MIWLDKYLNKFIEYQQYVLEYTLCKYDLVYFIENYCTTKWKPIKLNSLQKQFCEKYYKQINHTESSLELIKIEKDMQQFIEDCLKPIYQLQWLKTIPLENELHQYVLMSVAYGDNRLF